MAVVTRGIWVLVVLCAISFIGVCSSSSATLNNVTVKEGDDAVLPCSTKAKPLYMITWFKGSTKYINKKYFPPINTNKYVDRYVAINNQHGLVIKATVRQDSGEYECKALYYGSPLQAGSSKILLYVKAKPVIKSSIPSDYSFIQTATPKNLVISCRTTGFPKPEISWMKNGGKISSGRASVTVNGTLVVAKATKEDSGRYSCIASNEMGTDANNFTITVLEPPRIIGKTKFHFNAGVNAKLKCESLGNPEPKFTWSWKDIENNTVSLKDGEDDSRRRVSTVHGNASSVSTLTIDTITTQDWATYNCHVWNKFGKDDQDIILTGYTKPKSPRILAVKTSHDSAQVQWEFGDNGGLVLESLTLQYKSSNAAAWKTVQISPPDTTTYTIQKLKADTNYNFRVQATNQLGSSPPSAIYLAKTAVKESSVDALSDGGDKGPLAGISMTVLVAALAGGFLFILFVILGVLCSIRRRQKRQHEPRPNSNPSIQQDTTEMTAFLPNQNQMPEVPNSTDNTTVNPLSNSRWEFPRDRIRTSVVLGSGAFGVVMKAEAQGIKGCVGSLPVAVKIVKETDSDTARRDLLAELDLLKLIDPHPNVIGLLGCCTRGDPLMVIVEFCQYGDLQSYLRHCRGIEDKYYEQIYKVPEKKLNSKDLLSFGIQAARGMAHLASMKVVHRDLAARNILIDDKNVCKVSDFGFARDIYVEDHYTRKTQGGRFPIKWMAIESLLDGVSTTKSDVWSFAVLLWEIVTLGASPYPGMNSQEVINFLQDGYRMDKPKHCADELYSVMLDCWQVSPQRRPTFVEISRQLNKMLTDERDLINMRMYEDHLYVNFDGASAGTSMTLTQSLNGWMVPP